MSATILSANAQNWTLDSNGGWSNFTTGGLVFNNVGGTFVDPQPGNFTGSGTISTVNVSGTNGHVISDRKLVYDSWNRLIDSKASDGSHHGIYKYDALGRMISEEQSSDSADPGTTQFYYSQSWQIIREVHVNGATNTSRNNVYGITYVNDIAASIDNAGMVTYPLQDANHNVVSIYQSAGTNTASFSETENYFYFPYGLAQQIGMARTETNWHYLFQGGYFSQADGIYTFQHRALDPVIGHWMQSDPAGFVNGLNLHQAFGSNPINNVDPNGEFWGWGFAVGGAIIGEAAYIGGSWLTGNEITAGGAIGAAVGGFAAGAVVGAFAGDPTALAAYGAVSLIGIGALSGGVGGAASSITSQLIDHKQPFSWGKVGASAAGGAVAGAVGFGLFSGVSSAIGATTGLVLGGLVGGVGGGAAGGAVQGGIETRSWQGALEGGAAGAVYGGVGGVAGIGLSAAGPVIRNIGRYFAGENITPNQPPLQETAPGVSDDALVHFGKSQYSSVEMGVDGKSYWFRFGDVKHLAPSQIEGLIGNLAESGQVGNAKIMHVLDPNDVPPTVIIRPGFQNFKEYTIPQSVTPSKAIKIQ